MSEVPPNAGSTPDRSSSPAVSRRRFLADSRRAAIGAAAARWAAPTISTAALTQIAWHVGSPPPGGWPKITVLLTVTGFTTSSAVHSKRGPVSAVTGMIQITNLSTYPVEVAQIKDHVQHYVRRTWPAVTMLGFRLDAPCLASPIAVNGVCGGPYVATCRGVPSSGHLRNCVRVFLKGWGEPFIRFARFR